MLLLCLRVFGGFLLDVKSMLFTSLQGGCVTWSLKSLEPHDIAHLHALGTPIILDFFQLLSGTTLPPPTLRDFAFMNLSL